MLAKKLQVKKGYKVNIINAPYNYKLKFENLPDGTKITKRLSSDLDLLLFFVKNSDDLEKNIINLKTSLKDNTIFWIAYPKKSSGIKSDLSRDTLVQEMIRHNYEGVSLVSIDNTWSAMRLKRMGTVKSRQQKDTKRKVGNKAVIEKTGKSWIEWLRILDKARAKEMSHKEIAIYLKKNHNIGAWWAQMVTVTYEKERGLRDDHEKLGGFEISKSKTINVSLDNLFAYVTNKKLREKWLDKIPIKIRKETKNRSMRITWLEDNTNLELNFYEKSDKKSQIVAQHNKLKTKKGAEEKKKYWDIKLGQLKALLE